MSFNVQNNPFQGAYGFNYGSAKPQQQGAYQTGFSEYQAFLENQLLKRNANEQRKQKTNQQNQPQSLEQLWQQLGQQKQKVSRLQAQLDSTNDPQLQQMLKTMYGSESQSYFNLESQASLMFRGPGSGFVGSTGRIDHVGTFTTTS